MKGLLIYRVDFADVANYGVALKGKGQAKAYRKLGVDLDLISINEKNIVLNDQALSSLSHKNKLYRNHQEFWSIISKIDCSIYDFIHIRYPFATLWFVTFVKDLKDHTKLVIELPTYPYDAEFLGLKQIILKVDHLFRKSVFRRADYIIHYGLEQELFDTPCINISNGIDLDNFPLRSIPIDTERLHLIAVGKWQYWHGLDRLIEGLSKYGKKDVLLTIIGVGPESSNLQDLVKTLNLQDIVSFVGNKKGEELSAYFDQAHIAIGTLGMHRKNVMLDASLKHREYAARGIPFIYAGEDVDFMDCSFALKIENDDSFIDINLLIPYKYNTLDSRSIRKFSQTHLSWQTRINAVMSKINQKN